MASSFNPVTGKKLKDYTDTSSQDVTSIISDVKAAQVEWANFPIKKRSELLAKVGEVLLLKKSELAKICSEEMGKLYSEAIAEVEKCAKACQYYAENGEDFLKDDMIQSSGKESFVSYKPLGIILAIMPWNFPYWQVIRFAAPTLLAGNGALLKHASNVPGCSLELEKIFLEAGMPKNLFRSLIISSKNVGEVIAHPEVKAVSLTGSTKAGKDVAIKAGAVLKKAVLELGGSDAYLVLKDADLELAAKTLVQGRMMNAGQSCISPKRLIVVKEVYDSFIKLVEKEMKDLTFGDPFEESSSIGPLARTDLRVELHKQVEASVAEGAKCLLGGEVPSGEGAYYPPTLLVNVKPSMTAFKDELFGPVVCVVEAATEEEAIKLANESIYGLGGGVFSKDLNRARSIARDKLDTGGVFINDFLKSDPRLPFGGVKESGYGRELSFLGIKEFVNAKTVFIKG